MLMSALPHTYYHFLVELLSKLSTQQQEESPPTHRQSKVLMPLHIQTTRENKLSELLMLRVIKEHLWWSQTLDMCIRFLECV